MIPVVLDTTKVQIFKQITTAVDHVESITMLFQIPQRYRFSSKSQHVCHWFTITLSCFRYHKGTDFQANHNRNLASNNNNNVVLDTTKVQIFKQITTRYHLQYYKQRLFQIPQRYRFSSKSQHLSIRASISKVVLDTTKVQIFKQITTITLRMSYVKSCFRYHKGTDFQANHNILKYPHLSYFVVLDTTKVQIFKQITTLDDTYSQADTLFQIPQRYRFSSKSQHAVGAGLDTSCCFRYHKGTDFQANHNTSVRKL